MELAVGLDMLVLLGVLTLTGMSRGAGRGPGGTVRGHGEQDWLNPAPIEGNSVLRGGQTPRIEAPVGPLSSNLTIA